MGDHDKTVGQKLATGLAIERAFPDQVVDPMRVGRHEEVGGRAGLDLPAELKVTVNILLFIFF
jgi:hypothetical protein